MKSLEKLYYQFNFTQESLFLIGHSITGTAFKGISFFTDIQGITLKASDGEKNLNLLDKAKFKKKDLNQIVKLQKFFQMELFLLVMMQIVI